MISRSKLLRTQSSNSRGSTGVWFEGGMGKCGVGGKIRKKEKKQKKRKGSEISFTQNFLVTATSAAAAATTTIAISTTTTAAAASAATATASTTTATTTVIATAVTIAVVVAVAILKVNWPQKTKNNGTNLGRFHALYVFLLDHVDDLVGNAQVLDSRAANVALVHTPEVIAIARGTDHLLIVIVEILRNRIDFESYAELQIHPVVALDQMPVVSLAILQLHQHWVIDGGLQKR